MQRHPTRRSLPKRTLKSLLVGVVAALAALTVVATGGAAPAAGGGRVPHLEVHGTVLWVHVDRYTDVATRLREGTIHISAMDTCPPQTAEPPDCVDRMFISFGQVHPPERGDGYCVQVTSYPYAPNVMSLEGYGIAFVDGGEPGLSQRGLLSPVMQESRRRGTTASTFPRHPQRKFGRTS